jgi:hypothetical protein
LLCNWVSSRRITACAWPSEPCTYTYIQSSRPTPCTTHSPLQKMQLGMNPETTLVRSQTGWDQPSIWLVVASHRHNPIRFFLMRVVGWCGEIIFFMFFCVCGGYFWGSIVLRRGHFG